MKKCAYWVSTSKQPGAKINIECQQLSWHHESCNMHARGCAGGVARSYLLVAR